MDITTTAGRLQSSEDRKRYVKHLNFTVMVVNAGMVFWCFSVRKLDHRSTLTCNDTVLWQVQHELCFR